MLVVVAVTTEELWNFRSKVLALPGAKVPPWYFRSRERKYVGTKVPVTTTQLCRLFRIFTFLLVK